jgi:hypothetical protein
MGTESDQYSTPVKQMLGVDRGLSRDGRSRRHARAQIGGAPRGLGAARPFVGAISTRSLSHRRNDKGLSELLIAQFALP